MTTPNPTNDDLREADRTLRRMVERLIIENRNSLNDPTTNEPYDVKGIADDFVALLKADRQRFKDKLLAELPENQDAAAAYTEDDMTAYAFRMGSNATLDQCREIIEATLKQIGEELG